MRVVYILSGTNLFGGATKSFLNMLIGLQDKGVIPLVIVPDMLGLYSELKQRNIYVKSIPYKKTVYPRLSSKKDFCLFFPRLMGRLYTNYNAVLKLRNIVLDFKPDIIHTNVGVINIGYKIAMELKIPHIYHVREYGDLDFNYHYYPTKNRFISQFNRENSYAIFITKDIMKYFLLSENKYNRVIYNGVFSDKYDLSCLNKSDYLLWAGRVEPAKGTIDAILAYRNIYLRNPKLKTKLLIAGGIYNTEYYNIIRNIINESNLSEHVVFLGEIKDISVLMQKAKALIVTSTSEGFGRITAEAMFNSCLVIGKNTAGTKEQFDNGKELIGEEIGLRYNTLEELTQKIEEVLLKKNINYDRFISNSKKVVMRYYTIENNVERVYGFYKEICKNY